MSIQKSGAYIIFLPSLFFTIILNTRPNYSTTYGVAVGEGVQVCVQVGPAWGVALCVGTVVGLGSSAIAEQ